MSEICRVSNTDELVPGSLWVMPELLDTDMEHLQPGEYVPGTVLELIENAGENEDYAQALTVYFRVVIGSVPSWWIHRRDGSFSLVIPLTEDAASELVFTPIPLEVQHPQHQK